MNNDNNTDNSAVSVDTVVTITAALAHSIRLNIMRVLTTPDEYGNTDTSFCVSELVTELGYTQPLISQHLAKLSHAGLVHKKRMGRNVFYYAVDPVATRELIGYLHAFAHTMNQ